MNATRKIIGVILISLVVFSCAGFKYKYYGIIPSQQLLLGKSAGEDQPLTKCEPDAQAKGKCVVMFTDEFERMRADLAELSRRLAACEKK